MRYRIPADLHDFFARSSRVSPNKDGTVAQKATERPATSVIGDPRVSRLRQRWITAADLFTTWNPDEIAVMMEMAHT